MLLTKDSSPSEYNIRSYSPGKIIVNETTYTQSVIVSAKQLITDWQPQDFMQLQAQHFDVILQLKPEIVLLGTGQKQQFPNPKILLPFINHNIGVEIMETGAACRTFAVLSAELRNVVAALLIN